jgi:hypothetical protein
MRWYGHVLKMNEERIPKKILNMKVKVKGKCPRGSKRLAKTSHGRKNMRRN